MDDELLDLVNKNDIVIGTINRKDYKQLLAKDMGYIRASDLFIMNSKGRLYVPVRTAHKTIAPNGHDYSVGGHVGSGDDYLSTIIREAKEELNIDIQKEDTAFITKTVSETIKYIRCVYLMYCDETPAFNPDDFVSAEWLYPDELINKIDEGHPAKSSLKDTVILLQGYLDSHK
jgi:isopentenyl-diphosphate delta-isomerase